MATREEETCKKEEEMGIAANDEEDDEHDSKERVLQRYFLQEWKLVKSLLDDIVSNGRVSDPSSVHKIRSIMDKYQEQGQLLEPYLESMVSPLMFIIRSKTIELGIDSDEILQIIKPISIIIYSLVTVSGYKAVIKFFPHQVSDLELAVSLLEKCHNTSSVTSLRQESTGEMEAKCVMLLWLSILVLVPFDISSVDTSIVNSSGSIGVDEVAPLVLRIIGFSKDYLSNAGPMRTMAGLVLSKLLTRPDMPKALSSFIEWTQEVLSSTADDVVSHFQLIGAVEALAAIFKYINLIGTIYCCQAGSGRVLLDVVPTIWNDVSVLIKSGSASRSPLLRKYLVKLTQRIGLTCLPHRLPTWRYVGRTSSLGENISLSASNKNNQLNHGVILENSESEENSNCPEDEDMDVPEIVEEVIEVLLSGLKDTRPLCSLNVGLIVCPPPLLVLGPDACPHPALNKGEPLAAKPTPHSPCFETLILRTRSFSLPDILLLIVHYRASAVNQSKIPHVITPNLNPRTSTYSLTSSARSSESLKQHNSSIYESHGIPITILEENYIYSGREEPLDNKQTRRRFVYSVVARKSSRLSRRPTQPGVTVHSSWTQIIGPSTLLQTHIPINLQCMALNRSTLGDRHLSGLSKLTSRSSNSKPPIGLQIFLRVLLKSPGRASPSHPPTRLSPFGHFLSITSRTSTIRTASMVSFKDHPCDSLFPRTNSQHSNPVLLPVCYLPRFKACLLLTNLFCTSYPSQNSVLAIEKLWVFHSWPLLGEDCLESPASVGIRSRTDPVNLKRKTKSSKDLTAGAAPTLNSTQEHLREFPLIREVHSNNAKAHSFVILVALTARGHPLCYSPSVRISGLRNLQIRSGPYGRFALFLLRDPSSLDPELGWSSPSK
ncbi:hypothetical protein GOBAR_AA07635 [Gossypium barbadense]|uniref:Tubulin-folding cofactor D ARM repeats domain-containing protein n=1 Tax=Gossypium barbadense TaxID=3634 RepID=A0A2P5YBP8_GOSBA|nr:hypothetical protein GOBAR_AA07635 [Gossypium barbadense]